MKKLSLLFLFILMIFLSKTVLAQEVADTAIVHNIGTETPKGAQPKVVKPVKPFQITGRVLGVNLENVPGVSIMNIRTNEKVNTDSRGIFQINGAKGDTLIFNTARYSKSMMIVKSQKENLNLIMIKRKADNLPPGHSQSDYNKAKKEDDELYRILEKDAKLEGKWNY